MLFFFLPFSIISGYFFEPATAKKYKANTRGELVDLIITFGTSSSSSITIDEDLELACDELPLFADNYKELLRAEQFSIFSYRISSNKTDGLATFTLDTSSDSEDTCPGFLFSNIHVKFKGESLNTTIFETDKNVIIEFPSDFQLKTIKTIIPINQIFSFPDFAFCRLVLKAMDAIFPTEDFVQKGKISMILQYPEPNMFDMTVQNSTTVLFDNDTLSLTFSNQTMLQIDLPPLLNYSNAFYFRITGSNQIDFNISGDIHYTRQFPHYFFLTQERLARNANISIGPGNYFSALSKHFGIILGEATSLTFQNANLYWNNTNPIKSLTLTNVAFYIYCELNFTNMLEESTLSIGYDYGKTQPIYGSLITECDIFIFSPEIKPIPGHKIVIKAGTVTEAPGFWTYNPLLIQGDLYIRKSINIELIVDNLYCEGNPLLEVASSSSTLTINNHFNGTARVKVYRFSATSKPFYVGDIDNYDLSQLTIVNDNPNLFSLYKDGNYIMASRLMAEKCVSQTQTIRSTNDDNEWMKTFQPCLTTLTFSISKPTVTLDLAILASNKQPFKVIISPTVENAQISILLTQQAVDNINAIDLGSRTCKTANIFFLSNVKFHCPFTIYNKINTELIVSKLDLSDCPLLQLTDVMQLELIKNNHPINGSIVVTSSNDIIDFTYTDIGWTLSINEVTGISLVEIPGFLQPNICIKFSSIKNLTLRTTTKNPFPLFLAFDTSGTSHIYLVGESVWENLFQPIIIIAGVLVLHTASEIVPVNFDDNKFSESLVRSSRRSLTIDPINPRRQTLLSNNSTFILQQSMTIDTDSTRAIYFEFAKEAFIQRGSLISNKVNVIFGQPLYIDTDFHQRSWYESNTVFLVNNSKLSSPSFLDDITILWNYIPETKINPPALERCDQANAISFEFSNVSDINITEEELAGFNRPYRIMNAKMSASINCDTLKEKLHFTNDMRFEFGNANITFEIICEEIIFSDDPYYFTSYGLEIPPAFPMIGLFLNHSNITDEIDITIKDASFNNPGVIAGIVIACVAGLIMIISIVVYVFSKRKIRIDNSRQN